MDGYVRRKGLVMGKKMSRQVCMLTLDYGWQMPQVYSGISAEQQKEQVSTYQDKLALGTPVVCSLLRLYNFASTDDCWKSLNNFKDDIVGAVDVLLQKANKTDYWKSYKPAQLHQEAAIFAIVTGDQPHALRYFRELGWPEFLVPHYEKYAHTWSMFVVTAPDFLRDINYPGYEKQPLVQPLGQPGITVPPSISIT